MPRCMELLIPAFQFVPISDILNGPDTLINHDILGRRHWLAFKEHAAEHLDAPPVGIKCIYADPDTSHERVIGFAEWFIYPRQRGKEEYMQELSIMDMSWVDDEPQRERGRKYQVQVINARRQLMGGRPYGLLMWLCVDPKFRRRGVGSACVKWGMNRCIELRIPGYLEASEEGKVMYAKMGWRVSKESEALKMDFPVMIFN